SMTSRSSASLPEPKSVPARARGNGTIRASMMSRSRASARLTASASASPGSRVSARSRMSGCRTRHRIRVINSLIFRLVEGDRLGWHHRRDRMLVDKLGLAVTAEEDAEIVEPGDHALQFHAVHQENGDRHLSLADVIEKGVLQVLLVRCHFQAF